MKISSLIKNESLSRLKEYLNRNNLKQKYKGTDPPLRSELFSADQMEQHGKSLAKLHAIDAIHKPGQYLLRRLARNEEFLFDVHNLLTETVEANRQITPAGEWLLDNFYLIEEQIRKGKKHLSKGYSLALPRLLNGPSKTLPRVYDLALQIILHGDGRVDPESLNRFVSAYQTVTKLKLGELWAIPIMLRLTLIENLRRVAIRVAADRIERDLANNWADQMIDIAGKDPKGLILVVADMARSDPPMTIPFVSEFVRKLQGLSRVLALPLTWIEQRLSESGTSIEQLIQPGNQQQAADQVSISNSIGSLRFLDSMDWRKFVEDMSEVERILKQDPFEAYSNMDFNTRDRYRHIIEKLAKHGNRSEEESAQNAINLARESAVLKGSKDRTAHVGYYLVDKGYLQLEKMAHVRFSLLRSINKAVFRVPLMLYAGTILLLIIIFSAVLFSKTISLEFGDLVSILLGTAFIFSTSNLAVALVNWMATILFKPKPLPRMDYSEGIPEENRTLVVIPSMLLDSDNIDKLIEGLEIRFLANRNQNLHFGLLTDFKDADKETLEEDEPLLLLVCRKIEELNDKYNSADKESFFLFHRSRQWNPKEEKWMGYERKRGKLEELNSLLRGAVKNSFSIIIGKKEILPLIKYVITLDSDTLLPRDSARQLVGAMAHPLNRACFDKDKKRLVDGYSILQPRVEVSLPGTNRSRYARLYGSEPGIDPYTRSVSDVYQDLFNEGSFIGKGIYDVDSFQTLLHGRFPDNRILSHDLIEGCYSRSGLLSDVQLFEEYPSRYCDDVNRRSRWIRGDWQLLRWLLPYVPVFNGSLQKNPLSTLSVWKLLDNLRRSLAPLAMIIVLLLGWTILTQPWFWTISVIGIILIPSLIISIVDVVRKPEDVLFSQHFASAVSSIQVHFTQAAFIFITLPYEAYFSLEAIVRTLWRMLISRKRLLEWNPSVVKNFNSCKTLSGSYIKMWSSPFLAFGVIAYLMFFKLPLPLIVIPILFLWIISPAIGWWISLPLVKQDAKLNITQIYFLRDIARKTWSFFETFIGPEDNWIPPDNYQEYPVAVTAHRTSPTNMGLALLANLSAFDFGYITIGQLIDRTTNTFQTMESMERFKGHFYNWYDTQTLKPLNPLYISSVDSGNIAGHLLTLRQGLLELPNKPILEQKLFDGLSDTLRILIGNAGLIGHDLLTELQKYLDSLPPLSTVSDALQILNKLVTSTVKVNSSLAGCNAECLRWAHALAIQSQSAFDEFVSLIPWATDLSFPELKNYYPVLDEIPTLRKLTEFDLKIFQVSGKKLPPYILSIISEAGSFAGRRIASVEKLAKQANDFANLNYDFLYDNKRHLQSVGYNVNERRQDVSYYDLLASEARLSSFVAIAKGELPQESWFALGRLLTTVGNEPILLSWSGSMFEYLMPLLIMPTYENTILDQTYKAAVKRQINYGKERGVPWGISESGFNTVDVNLNYQYRAFGVPGLGLKRGLADDLVIAPYASALALMVFPAQACLNLQQLSEEGSVGQYGFYEAIDHTKSRLPRGQSKVFIKSFMAHHQGMSLLSLDYLIHNRPMQRRFESDPSFAATMLLLQERIPKATVFYSHTSGLSDTRTQLSLSEMSIRVINNPDTPVPEVHLLSNGKYHLVITNSGGGYSRWKDIAVTRWHEDSTCDNWGNFFYIRDELSGEFWSATYQPTLKRSKKYEAIFSEGRAEFRRQDHNLDMHTEIVVSPEDDIEVRRIRITNRSRSQRKICLLSYAEVVLASTASDLLHPAFSNLFVQTEILSKQKAILCSRRPRSIDEQTPWMLHLMTVHAENTGEVSFETDRMQFIGRGNSLVDPKAVNDFEPLSGSMGSVLDPVAAIKYQIMLEPEEIITVDMIFGIGETRETAFALVNKYQDRQFANRVFELAWTHSQVALRQINAVEADAQIYARLASFIIYPNSFLRTETDNIIKNKRGQSGLWGYSISGDLPIVLLKIENPANLNIVRQMVQAHSYWRLKGLAVDLVIWNEDHAGYRQILQEQIMMLIAAGVETNIVDRPGGIFIRQSDQISNEDRILIQTVARVIISDIRGTLEEQINNINIREVPSRRLKKNKTIHFHISENPLPRTDLVYFNGIGGFTPDGREYIITTTANQRTPAPWVNVIANQTFGTIVSENGPNYTWSENAHEFRITPWNNDPVTDSSGEAFYIRDEETGRFWSPTALPAGGTGTYVCRHGFGYSVFEHNQEGIRSELWIYVAINAPVKFSALKIWNESGRPRRLTITGFVELVLGDLHSKSGMFVITESNPGSSTLFARNQYNSEFTDRVVFFQTDSTSSTFTCDRTDFIGRNGTLRNPAAMNYIHLSGKIGAALDPCAAIQVPVELAENQEQEIIFRLGSGTNKADSIKVLSNFRGATSARNALEAVWNYWNNTLSTVRIETPDAALNIMTNGWLLYQTLVSRFFARSGYYQSGGAYGFRDQLQDAMALIHTKPELLRQHLLLCASRQFVEGDVQHWWHPPSGRGVRTHCSDDYLWLPLATSRYVLFTGDTGVLDELISFLEGRPLNAEDDSYYDLPTVSEEKDTLYNHCVRSIWRGLNFGKNGLPLIGTGDWNDGMNMVGRYGKGESVWLAFFLYDVLKQFIKIAELKEHSALVERCRQEAEMLRRNIELNGWDGEWYRRAYFDDGLPLGSASNTECKIDSIAQSWSVISGAAETSRSRIAMKSLDKYLVRREYNLIQLLDPPFDKSNLNPGYIKGYVPGVRENGGQYTHAAIWAAMAFTELGDNKSAWELMSIINPINHSSTNEKMLNYKVEPYVIAADIYALAPHIGRGGWTWYTGSAGWMYRLSLESLLGLRLETNKLTIKPCIPIDWESYKVHYRYRATFYHITIFQTFGAVNELNVIVDGNSNKDNVIPLIDDRKEHTIEVRIVKITSIQQLAND